MAQVRRRPLYPHLRNDNANQMISTRYVQSSAVSEATDEPVCSKFYSRYKERRQTGGIMAFWCQHCVCVGFHCIPSAEGLNDVFLGCALGPYCLKREAEFFKNTRFLIDQMHHHDHTKCSAACFMSNYMGLDSEVGLVNTSAAECRNAYCSQKWAILLTRAYIDVWNRLRILKL
ncbi:hypothetical protein BT69DRAFT_1307022 [Atractiella rhizophila]|nr:hypothetical protein BT69DRAFT_1307022 [Atractiella rhizophila]